MLVPSVEPVSMAVAGLGQVGPEYFVDVDAGVVRDAAAFQARGLVFVAGDLAAAFVVFEQHLAVAAGGFAHDRRGLLGDDPVLTDLAALRGKAGASFIVEIEELLPKTLRSGRRAGLHGERMQRDLNADRDEWIVGSRGVVLPRRTGEQKVGHGVLVFARRMHAYAMHGNDGDFAAAGC
jgi:hypothetical protein